MGVSSEVCFCDRVWVRKRYQDLWLDVLKTLKRRRCLLGFTFYVFSELDDIQLTFGYRFNSF